MRSSQEILKSFGGIFSLIAFIPRPNMRTHCGAPAEDFWNNFVEVEEKIE